MHEASRVWTLHPLLRAGDLLVGDRAFCSYVHLAMLDLAGALGLFSVHQRQKVSFKRGRRHGGKGQPASRFIRKLARHDQLVEWLKPKQRPGWMKKKQYDALPAGLIVRELRYSLEACGQRTRTVTIVTTLIDADLYPADKIAELYGLRWQVETHFAQLKTHMKRSQLKCKTTQGIKKELLIHFISYNLIRKVIRDAADRQERTIGRISFIDALRWLANARKDQEMIVLAVIPLRPGRHEPRVKKYLKYRYRLMCKPRHILKRRPYLYGDKVM
ncbi:MAG: transposase [Tepidisphaeraceae bacterium]